MPKAVIYYENWVLKKEGVNKWTLYWACIRGNWLQFYERQDEYERPELRKTLELTKGTTCALVKRNKNRLPFSIDNGIGVYYLKCDAELQRYHWIFSILSAANGKPKRDLPEVIPISMQEKEAFRKLTKIEKKEEKLRNAPTEPEPKEPKNAADVKNKRRRKFAVRQENKMKRKEATRLKKLGLEPPSKNEESPENEPQTIVLENRLEKLQCDRYVKNMEFIKKTNQKITVYKDKEKKEMRESVQEQRPQTAGIINMTQSNHRQNKQEKQTTKQQRPRLLSANPSSTIVTTKDEVVVMAMVHKPSNIDSFVNDAFDDIEELPTIPVILADDDDSVLPNMVFTELSSSDPETASTEEISLNSQNSILLSLSANDLSTLGTGSSNNSRRNSAVKTSHTIISDDGDFQQVDFTGRVISSPDISKMRRSRPSSPTVLNDPKSMTQSTKRPISPHHKLSNNPFSPLGYVASEIKPAKNRNNPFLPENQSTKITEDSSTV